MASSPIYGAETVALTKTISDRSIAFPGSDFHPKYLPKLWVAAQVGTRRMVARCSLSASRTALQPRFIQHNEAFWFYKFRSIAYDHVINPGHWTEDMCDEVLEPTDLSDRSMVAVDVGGGAGFTTLGFVKHVDAENVMILDQSPHQLAKAREKEPLKECKII